jgi:hypothetical protein
MKFSIMQFSPIYSHFIPLRSKYYPQHPVLKQRDRFSHLGLYAAKSNFPYCIRIKHLSSHED